MADSDHPVHVHYHPGICSSFIHSVVSNDYVSRCEGSEQTAQMHRLIWPFAVCICPKTCFRMVQPKYRIQPNYRTVCLGFQKCWENLWWNMYLPILKVHFKKKKKLWRTYQIKLMRCFSMLFVFLIFIIKHMLWVLIWIASTSRCNSNGYPQYMPL